MSQLISLVFVLIDIFIFQNYLKVMTLIKKNVINIIAPSIIYYEGLLLSFFT